MENTDISLLSDEFKYIKMTSEGISVADDNKPQDFTTAIKLKQEPKLYSISYSEFSSAINQ